MTKDQGPNIDPSLWRGLTQSRFSRREMLRYAGVGAGTAGLAAFLAACGTKGALPAGGPSGQGLPNAGIGTPAWWDKQKLTHKLEFANWPYYIDVSHGKHPSIEEFTQKTGIQVDYREVIQDNNAVLRAHLAEPLGRAAHRLRHHRDDEQLAAAGLPVRGRLADPARPPQDDELQQVRRTRW